MRIIEQHPTTQGRAAGVIWIQRAADQDLAVAQDRLGLMYLYGDGVEQNTSLGLEWIRKAAERGAPAAQMQLGNLYSNANGNLVPLDDAEAYYWYSIAAKPVTPDVHIYNIDQVRDLAQQHARAVAPTLTDAQRAAIDQRVLIWAPTPSVPYSGIVRLAQF